MSKLIKILFVILSCIILLGPSCICYSASDTGISEDTDGAPKIEYPSDPPLLDSGACILFESSRGQVLYSMNEDLKLYAPIANRIMTALLAVETGLLNENVIISQTALKEKKPSLEMEAGEKKPLESLINAMMLIDSENAANAVAEHIGKDIRFFINKMNEKASEFGMKDTYFGSVSGSIEENDYTTAGDLRILVIQAMKNPDFYRIFSYEAKSWYTKTTPKILTNINSMFWSYAGVDGGIAEIVPLRDSENYSSIITSASSGRQRLFCIMMQADSTAMYDDTANLLDYGFSKYLVSLLVSKNNVLSTYAKDDKQIDLISSADVFYTHPIGQSFVDQIEYRIRDDVKLPITLSSMIGTARYTLKDGTVIDINLFPASELYPPDDFITSIKKKLNENKDIMMLLIVLCTIEAIIILYYSSRFVFRLFKNRAHNNSKEF